MNQTLEKVLRYIALGIIFLIPFVVLVVIDGSFFPYISGKNFAFRILVEVISAIWLILLVLNPREYKPKKSYILYSLIALVGISTLSAIFGENPYRSFWSNFERMEGLLGLIHVALYFIVLSVFLNSEKLWKWFFTVSILGAIYVSFYGLLQHFFGIGVSGQGGERIDGTFGNAIYLAGYSMFHAILAVFILFKRDENTIKIITAGLGALFLWTLYLFNKLPTIKGLFYVALVQFVILVILYVLYYAQRQRAYIYFIIFGSISALFVITLYLTQTRGSMLGLIAAILVGLALYSLRATGKIRITAVIFLAAVLLLVGGLYAYRNSEFVKSRPTLNRFTSISISEGTGRSRFMLWNLALEGVKEKPILGWGQENFNIVFNKHFDPNMWDQEQWFDRAHSVFIDWMIAGGILGFLAYIALYISAMFYLLKRNSVFTRYESSVLVGLLIGNAIQSLFVFDNLGGYMTFAMILAYIYRRASSDQGDVVKGKNISSTQSTTGVIGAICAVITLALIFSIYYFNLKPLNANLTLIKAISFYNSQDLAKNIEYFNSVLAQGTFAKMEVREQMLQGVFSVVGAQKYRNQDKENFVKLTVNELEKQVAQTPGDARYQFFLGALYRGFGNPEIALPYLEKAVELSPKKQFMLFELISALVDMKRYKEAEEVALRTLNFAPNFQRAQMVYMSALLYSKNITGLDKFFDPTIHQSVLLEKSLQAVFQTENRLDKYAEYANKAKSVIEQKIGGRPLIKDDCIDMDLLIRYYEVLKHKNNTLTGEYQRLCAS